jgi:putative sugar O-methyltransferase
MSSLTLNKLLATLVNRALARFDLKIARRSQIDELERTFDRYPQHRDESVPTEARAAQTAARLARLEQLRRDYEKLPFEHSVWTRDFVAADAPLERFRDDTAYVWQNRDRNREINYIVDALYLRSRDKGHLLDRLDEDGRFGALTVDIEGRCVSRDLLDSVSELLFLDEHVGLEGRALSILDIGAGYGRLAHRTVTAFPTLRYYCTDAIPESTFLCEYYLEQRHVADRAKTIPLYDIERLLSETKIDLALNIQSFTECTNKSIAFWLDLVAKNGVKYLFIVPGRNPQSEEQLLSFERDGIRRSYASEVTKRGYVLKVRQPKYLDARILPYGVSPVEYYLFERQV